MVTKRLISSDTWGVERQGSRQYNMQPVSIQPYYTSQDLTATRSIQPQVSMQRQSSVQPQLTKYKWGSQYSLTKSVQPDYIDQADFKASLHEQIRSHPMRLTSESNDEPDDLASTSPTKSRASSKRIVTSKLKTHSEQIEEDFGVVYDTTGVLYDTTDDEDAVSDTASNKTTLCDEHGNLISPDEYRRRQQANLDEADGLPPPPSQPPLPPPPTAPEPPKIQPPPPTKRLY